MKTAITSKGNGTSAQFDLRFGRAAWFCVIDDETGNTEFFENDCANLSGGAGIKAAQIIVDNEVDVLLTPRCGENAAGVLENAGIKMYKTVGDSVSSNIEAYNAGKLSLLEDIHAGLHDHGKK